MISTAIADAFITVDTTVTDMNSPPAPFSNDRVKSDLNTSAAAMVDRTTLPSKRPFITKAEQKSVVSNVSVSSSSSIGSSSDDESTAPSFMTSVTNKKQKISGIISDDGSDDDDVVPSVVVSGSMEGKNRSFPQEQDTKVSPATSNSIAMSHYQKKYEPPTSKNMSKVELSLWRKQQRQQRNRMSAAASRQKQKARITELEQLIADYQQKYAAVQMEIQRMQQKSRVQPIITASSMTNAQDVNVCQGSCPPTQGQLPVDGSNITTGTDSVHPNTNIVPSSPSSELVNLSLSNTPFKMISRQALSQELSFTPPQLFFHLM